MAAWRWRNFPIPEAFLSGSLAGVILHLLRPVRLTSDPRWLTIAGGVLMAAGFLLAWLSARAFGRAFMEKPDHLVVTGTYARSRNPMYLAWVLIQAGLSLVMNSPWPGVLLPAAFGANHFLVVLREEKVLEALFGEEYRRYRGRVRRYL